TCALPICDTRKGGTENSSPPARNAGSGNPAAPDRPPHGKPASPPGCTSRESCTPELPGAPAAPVSHSQGPPEQSPAAPAAPQGPSCGSVRSAESSWRTEPVNGAEYIRRPNRQHRQKNK